MLLMSPCCTRVERGGETPPAGDGVFDMIKMALHLMDGVPSSSKAPKDDPDADIRTALLKAQVKAVEEQAKLVYTNGRADILLRMLEPAHLSEEQRKQVLDQFFALSSAP